MSKISRRSRHSLYVKRFISLSSYVLPFPRNVLRGPAIHVFLVTEYDSNPFRRNKSTSRLRRSLGRCATSLRSLLTTYERQVASLPKSVSSVSLTSNEQVNITHASVNFLQICNVFCFKASLSSQIVETFHF